MNGLGFWMETGNEGSFPSRMKSEIERHREGGSVVFQIKDYLVK